ncbi:MAG: tRNA (guanosine(46)-N7)-methyltransferase TrmB [Lachnospiraceae bacterium]|nr:tRNA (guanosine(46)-N7)-methyltransferase TrmB [Lachnospiraceae bacterium]
MRLRNIPEAKGIVENSSYVVKEPEQKKGCWKAYFEERRNGEKKEGEAEAELFVEIGMGKGRFAVDMALAHPDRDFIGVELYESVLFRACERMEGIPYNTPRDQRERAESGTEGVKLEVPDNLHFLSMDAKNLSDVFAEGEVDGIYLNFSDPWPKARHAKRRLTSRNFLATYERYLKDGGRLVFKTDNVGLFDFSVEEMKEVENWELLSETHDLHHDPVLNEGNIMTEYERKFSALGNKICRMEAVYHKPEKA